MYKSRNGFGVQLTETIKYI